MPPPRRRPGPLKVRVVRSTDVTPTMRRVTLTGDDLATYVWPGPAAHFKLVLPHPDGTLSLPTPDAEGLVDWSEAPPFAMRTYTARAFRPDSRELDVDLVLHGDGPAARWAALAGPGDEVAVTRSRGSGFLPPDGCSQLVLAGDPSAFPALATILETGVTATVLVSGGGYLPSGVRVVPDLREALAAQPLEPGAFVWVAAEAAEIRSVRADLVARGVPRDHLVTRGYWRAGTANHPDHDYGEDDA